MSEIDQLVKMSNQIAANFSFHDDGVERVADHIQRFWPPVMKTMLKEFASKNDGSLDQLVLDALPMLRVE
jgi:hypothetical protein